MSQLVQLPRWSIPIFYVVAAAVAAVTLPRLEAKFIAHIESGISAAAALAFFSAVSAGMMALTGIVFAVAFVVVQFSAMAYSPRLSVVMGSSRFLFHTLGLFF